MSVLGISNRSNRMLASRNDGGRASAKAEFSSFVEKSEFMQDRVLVVMYSCSFMLNSHLTT